MLNLGKGTNTLHKILKNHWFCYFFQGVSDALIWNKSNHPGSESLCKRHCQDTVLLKGAFAYKAHIKPIIFCVEGTYFASECLNLAHTSFTQKSEIFNSYMYDFK